MRFMYIHYIMHNKHKKNSNDTKGDLRGTDVIRTQYTPKFRPPSQILAQ